MEMTSGKMDRKWFQIILRNDELLTEFEDHKKMGSLLCTKMYFGKKMFESLEELNPKDSLGMLSQLNWTEEFVLIDILNYKMGVYGGDITKRFIRVEETPTWNNVHVNGIQCYKPRFWDIVVFPECCDMIEEMIYMKVCGMKTTVAIWNSVVIPYNEIKVDGEDEVIGEIFLKPSKEAYKVLTAVIFHQEKVSEAKARRNDLLSERFHGLIRKRNFTKEHMASFVTKINTHTKNRLVDVAAPIFKAMDYSNTKSHNDDFESCSTTSSDDDKGEFVLDSDVETASK